MAKRQGRYSCVGLFSALPSGLQRRFFKGLSENGYTPGMTNLQGKMMIHHQVWGVHGGTQFPDTPLWIPKNAGRFTGTPWFTCEAECHCHSRHLQPQTSGCHLAAFKWPSASLCLRPLVFDVGPWSLKELILGENIWITGVLCL